MAPPSGQGFDDWRMDDGRQPLSCSTSAPGGQLLQLVPASAAAEAAAAQATADAISASAHGQRLRVPHAPLTDHLAVASDGQPGIDIGLSTGCHKPGRIDSGLTGIRGGGGGDDDAETSLSTGKLRKSLTAIVADNCGVPLIYPNVACSVGCRMKNCSRPGAARRRLRGRHEILRARVPVRRSCGNDDVDDDGCTRLWRHKMSCLIIKFDSLKRQ